MIRSAIYSPFRISIHALRVEGDARGSPEEPRKLNFYPRPPGGGRHDTLPDGSTPAAFLSTPSGWRATCEALDFHAVGLVISIHALRVEGDCPDRVSGCRSQCISIHALRVEGDGSATATRTAFTLFLSTPSGWRATCALIAQSSRIADFYPRPPGGGRRWTQAHSPFRGRYFYPRPPGGGRLAPSQIKAT